LFSTIHQIINTKLGKVVTEMILNNLKPTAIRFKAEKDMVVIDYLIKTEVIFSIKEKLVLNLDKLRKNNKDDIQAITAVHEAGHAILSIILLKTIPEVIFSTTADSENHGFVYTKFKWKYISRKEVIPRLAMFLGGYMAEKLIFGEENTTTGAEEDISNATLFITHMIKECGMGRLPAAFQARHASTVYYLHDIKDNINSEIEKLIHEALVLAERTLNEQESLLIKMADYLSDNRTMDKKRIKELVDKHSIGFNLTSIIENGDNLYYRKQLKTKLLNLDKNRKSSPNLGKYSFSMNSRVSKE